jgi:membrane fusion protein (multidrug efflux system)
MTSSVFSKTVIGVLKGKKEIIIKTKSQGLLEKILIKEGRLVKQGEVLAQIESKKEQLEKKMAESDYKSAQEEFVKSKKLKKYLSSDELLKKKRDYQKKKNLLELKKLNLEAKNIVSPISGVVSRKFVSEGENISSGIKAFEVIKYHELLIDLYIESKYINRLELGKNVKFKQELDESKTFSGSITYISPVLDKSSGTFHVKVELLNPKDNQGNFVLKPGSMVKVKLDK